MRSMMKFILFIAVGVPALVIIGHWIKDAGHRLH